MRFVAPPGMSATPSGELSTIGRYEIIKTLGRGAMGVVYKARDPLLDRIVAVKTIGSPKGVGKRVRAAYLERFEREAKAAAKMQHPAIVTIFDVGLEDGAPFMVLEYLPGETLADRLDRVRLPLGRVISTALDLGSALGFAHKQRIVHRDMKPANVLHAGEDRWKLADFGIARLPDSDLTQVGIFMGTPGYSPPEAIREGRYTPQADVFAWGAVLYELLSGYIPYEGPDTQTTNSFVLKGAARSPKHYDPSIPDPLAEVTMRALSPDTSVRFKDGSEAESALRKAWENCLRQNLVTPASLAGDELPHERVGGEMHSTGSFGSEPATHRDPAPAAPAALVIESERVSDDDPTTIMIREGDAAIEDLQAISDDDDEADPTLLGKKKGGVAGREQPEPSQEARYETAIHNAKAGRGKLWVVALLLLVLGGAAALYATGYLK
ncbi:MAG TPA: serine/threonine-protein kinase [Kofleriaceae bacterium]|nr:serine/threonine-protein kinase [Kofleriaceae bacterium]